MPLGRRRKEGNTMSELSNPQKESLTDQLAQVYSYEDPEGRYPEDTAHECIDSWLPVYYGDIVREWMEANMPNVDDPGMIDGDDRGDISRLMQIALYEQANAWVSELFSQYSEDDVETAGQALTACNTYLAVRGLNTYTRDGHRAKAVTA
jgi:hypothetical protein